MPSAPPYLTPDGDGPWGPPLAGPYTAPPVTPEPPSRRRPPRALAVAAVVLVGLVGGYFVTSLVTRDSQSNHSTTTVSAQVSPGLAGTSVAEAPLSGGEFSNPDAFDGGVMLTTGFDQSVAYSDTGSKIRSFDAAMFPDGNGAFRGLSSDGSEYLYWKLGGTLVRTTLQASPISLRAVSETSRLVEVVNDRATVSDLATGAATWNGTFESDAIGTAWAGDSVAAVDSQHRLEVLHVGSTGAAAVNDTKSMAALVNVFSFGGRQDTSMLLATDTDGVLRSFDPVTAKQRWSVPAPATAVADRSAYDLGAVLWANGSLIDPASGRQIWTTPAIYRACEVVSVDLLSCTTPDGADDLVQVANPASPPVRVHGYIGAVAGGIAYVVDGKTISATAVATGTDQWTTPANSRNGWAYALGLTHDQLLVADGAGNLVVLDRATGAVSTAWKLRIAHVSIVEVGNGVAYVISADANGSHSVLHVVR